jgi:hypothetical protein
LNIDDQPGGVSRLLSGEPVMNGDLGVELAVFLAGFWAATKSLLDASAFVNDLRDTVTMGVKGHQSLSLMHRKALRLDWVLTMFGAVGFPIAFSGILFAVAASVDKDEVLVHAVLHVVAYIPLIGSLLFAVCGISDWRLMNNAIKNAKPE